MMVRQEKGFTLLEMLVALTVFALVSAMVYGGQVAVLKLKAGTEAKAEQLKRLQRTMVLLQRDIGQHVLRPVRDEFGSVVEPMRSSDMGEYLLEFTRDGWQNPLAQPRSTLQRVAYGLEDEKLVRYSWQSLDRVQGSEPYKQELLPRVRSFEMRFLDQGKEWQGQWPAAGAQSSTMPLVVEVTIELEQGGSFRRVFPTVAGS